jgi:hypothetical protein
MGIYIKHKKNYWERKILNNNKLDLELFKPTEIELDRSKKIFKKYVELVCLELSYYCNRACSYCPVSIFERSDKNLELDTELFTNIINSLSEINFSGRVSLNLFNEPLASKNFLSNVKKIKGQLPNAILSCNSNGDYIKNFDTFNKISKSGLAEILITLHPPKNKRWTREYAELSLKRFAKRIDYKLSSEELNNIKFWLYVDDLYIEVFCTNWDEKGNSRGGLMKNLSEKVRTNPCEKPIRELVISYDGSIQLCCHSYQNKEIDNGIAKVDKDDQNSIFKIYMSKTLSRIRKGLFSYSEKSGICKTCNHYEDNFRTDINFFLSKNDKEKRNKILKKINI